MKQKFLYWLALGTSLMACNGDKKQENMLKYPNTRLADQTDDYFGTQVADPYRWLEDDNAEETKAWVKSQNAITDSLLAAIPFRDEMKARLEKIWNYERIGSPFKAGDGYYFFKNNGLQNQSVLMKQASLDGTPEEFLDPNKLSSDGTVALSTVEFSKDGKYMGYMLQTAGSDWSEIRIMETATKKELPEQIKWVKFSGMAWQGDGFYYSRYDAPKEGNALKAANEFQKLYFHKIGTAQEADILVHEDKQHPQRGFSANTTEDERFLVVGGWESTYGNTLQVKDLSNKNAKFIVGVDNFENEHSVLGNVGDKLYILTSLNAANKRIMVASAAKPQIENWQELIAERPQVIEEASMVGGKIVINYLADARSSVIQFSLDGQQEREIALPAIGTATGFVGKMEDTETYYSFSSFAFPPTIYRYNIGTGESVLFRSAKVDFKPEDFETKQVFYTSKDGTKVPMFIVHKKGLQMNGENPTCLYGYGGFSASMTPGFSVARLVFMELGGVFAMANLRGGAEYGEKWHEAGTKMKKQNVFDDFIAAAEYLKTEKYTSANRLAISGGSNGGLLVGATMTQRPDLCKVALPAVGVLDMLRYQHFTIGHAWASDYGTAQDSKEMFEYLYKYSPLHAIKAGVNYPATLVTTADHDDRVVPAHSFKFISALQAAHKGSNPVVIRIEENAGHGSGKPVSKTIQEWADVWSFTFSQFGLNPFKK